MKRFVDALLVWCPSALAITAGADDANAYVVLFLALAGFVYTLTALVAVRDRAGTPGETQP